VADAMGLSADGAGQDSGDLGPVVRRWLGQTGTAACSSSTTQQIAICSGLSFRLTVRPTCW